MDEKSSRNKKPLNQNSKQDQLDHFRISNKDKPLTRKQGLKISNDENNLKAGIRGPTFLSGEAE